MPRASAEVVGLLKRWYAGKNCVFCSRPIGPIHGEPRPGLLDRETHRAVAWRDVSATELPAALDRYQPVCANCFTAEAFRSLYPDRVVDRAPTPLRDSAMHSYASRRRDEARSSLHLQRTCEPPAFETESGSHRR